MKRIFLLALLAAMGFVPTVQAKIEVSEKFAVHGEVRARDEQFRDYDFDSDSGNDSHLATLRTTLGFTLKPVENVAAVVEFRDWRRFGEEGYRSDPDNHAPGIHQAYMDTLFHEHWHARVGRQELNFGTRRMWGSYDRYKGLYHDAVVLGYTSEKWDLHAFLSKWYENSTNSTGSSAAPDSGDDFGSGLNFDYRFTEKRVLNAQLTGGKLNSWGDDPTLVNLDLSFTDDELSFLFWGIEPMLQFGSKKQTGADDISHFAWAFHAHVGGKFGDEVHRIWLEVDVASGAGEDDVKNDESHEFIQFFGDTPMSTMDVFPLQNIVHGGLRYQGRYVEKKLTFDAGIHFFTMMTEYGRIYGIDSITGFPDAGHSGNGEDTDLGLEIDLGVSYLFFDCFDLGVNLGVFSPGDAMHEDGDIATYGSLQGRLKI